MLAFGLGAAAGGILPAFADYDAGKVAYESGDFAGAFDIWSEAAGPGENFSSEKADCSPNGRDLRGPTSYGLQTLNPIGSSAYKLVHRRWFRLTRPNLNRIYCEDPL